MLQKAQHIRDARCCVLLLVFTLLLSLLICLQPGKLVPLRDATIDVLDKMEEAVLSSDGKKQQEEKNKKQAAKSGRAVTPVPGTLKQ